MSAPIDVIAIITPKPGKADRIHELLLVTAEAVKTNEPGALRYHIQRETEGDAPTFIVLETYQHKASLVAHGQSKHFKELENALKEEELLAQPMQGLFTKEIGGHASKL